MINYEMLNNNLFEVETIIDSRYHFSFADLNGEDMVNSELLVSIIQARVIAEGICRYIVLQENLVKDEKSIRTATLKVYIDDLLRPNLIIPKPIISNFATIQEKSNLAVHFQVEGQLDLKQANLCIESLELVLEWFVKTYRKETLKVNKWKVSSDMLNRSGAVPPKAEGCLISRDCEVDEIRKKIVSHNTIFLHGQIGIGKTEIVKDYVKKYQKKYVRIYYVENVDDVDDYIYEMPIGILDEEKKTKEEIIEEKKNEIHSMGLVYLFILDNYTGDRKKLQSLYPNENDRYHLMVSVCDEYKTDDRMGCYEVNAFSPQDSLNIFRYFCNIKYREEEIMSLLSYLSYNPRAIKMSAIFLQDNSSYTPIGLMESMKRNSSIKSIMQNLYIVLTDIAILENDKNMRLVAECLSLIPYNGVAKERFVQLLCEGMKKQVNESNIKEILGKLENEGWISVDDSGIISINPLLSDTIFEKTHPDMTSKDIVKFVSPILKPIREIRELYISQVIALEPFVEHLAKRVKDAKRCDLGILNDIREYYIAVYNVTKINLMTELMEQEFARQTLYQVNIVEEAIYRQGISRFNLEDFSEAHIHFSRALEMLDCKKIVIDKLIARISAYEGTSLAAIGEKENAIASAKRSINLREKLGEDGDQNEIRALWISHYNYAKTLLELEMCEDAEKEIDIAILIYEKHYPEEYGGRKSIDVSSLLQLKGRICAGLGKFEEAIQLLEEAKTIREKLKGETYFSTAQIYSYLMDVYSECEKFEQALYYATLYYDVLIVQHKTKDIEAKIKDVNRKITIYKEKLGNAQI